MSDSESEGGDDRETGDDSGSAGSSAPDDNSSDGSTTEAASTSSSTTGDGSSFCGDGEVGPREECDDGEENGPNQACLDGCRLNVCGDGDLGPTEACDDGDGNVLEVGACAPDCSRIIEIKQVVLGELVLFGSLQPDELESADERCDPGYKALLSVAGLRQFAGRVDWPIQPFTAYVNSLDQIVWITDHEPALGRRDGDTLPLEESILAFEQDGISTHVVTSTDIDWSPLDTDNCNGWSSGLEAHVAALGNPFSRTQYLSGGPQRPCDSLSGEDDCDPLCTGIVHETRVYCIEQ